MSKPSSPWITVIGIGEDGLDGIAPASRTLVETAEVLVGGERHLEMAPDAAEVRMTWGKGFDKSLPEIEKHRGRRVVVLASGDPLNYGAGSVLLRQFSTDDIIFIPAVGAFSLAAARMGWPLPDVETLTIHGRPMEKLNYHLFPGLRLIVLSRDGETPGEVAKLLTTRGFGKSHMTVLDNMGGANERRIEGNAEAWSHAPVGNLNTVAIECIAEPGARVFARVPGLPDDAFEHDGQLTKREIRAVTVSSLAPKPGQTLWDVGAGNGSVAIEWMRSEVSAKAIAIEKNPDRAAAMARNASNLGVPMLKIILGTAPDALSELTGTPDAVFIGGGVTNAGVIEMCWQRLASGGRLVANAVTAESEGILLSFCNEMGGNLSRLQISRAASVGGNTGFVPMRQVTQYVGVKP